MKKQRKPRAVWVAFDKSGNEWDIRTDRKWLEQKLANTARIFPHSAPFTIEKYVREVKRGRK